MSEKGFMRFPEVVVSDAKLAAFLRLLPAHAASWQGPQPMVNAAVGKNGHVTPISSGELVDMFAAYLREHRVRQFSRSAAEEFLVSIGRATSRTSYLLTRAKEEGLIKNISTNPTTGKWVIRSAAASKRKPTKTRKPKRPAALAKEG